MRAKHLAVLALTVPAGVAFFNLQQRPAWLPDKSLTPGAVVQLPATAICERRYASQARDVSEATKRLVFARYGIPWADHSKYEVDHLVNLGIGGSNAVENLWPQPWEGQYGAREKDRLEARLRSLVCKGSMSLVDAQTAMRSDWAAEYRRQGLDKPRLGAGLGEPDTEGFEPDGDDDHQ